VIGEELKALWNFDEIYKKFRWEIPELYNIARDACDKHAGNTGNKEKIAMIYIDAEGKEKNYTFHSMKSLSNKFANVLKRLGIERGDRVAVLLLQSPEAAISHLGIYKIGAVAVALSPRLGEDALLFRLKDSGARVVVTDSKNEGKIRDIKCKLDSLDETIVVGEPSSGNIDFRGELESAPDDFDTAKTTPNDPALIVYTSGTEGSPKGALQAHRTLLGRLTGFLLAQNFPKEGSILWSPAEWAWVGGLLDCLLAPWSYGMTVLSYEGGFNPKRIFSLMGKYKVTHVFLPPTVLRAIMNIKVAWTKFNLSLKGIHSAGEFLGSKAVEWAEKNFGIPVNEVYGQTEASFLVGNSFKIMPIRPGSMGKPYPGHRVEVVDPESGEVLPPDEVGEIAVRMEDPTMFLGYWGKPQETERGFKGKWWLTGDLAYRDGDGYLWFMGRRDEVILSAGYRIGPAEVEECTLMHPAVLEAAVVAKPDKLRGSIVKAYIKLNGNYKASPKLKREIRGYVKDKLGSYLYPREIDFVEDFPRTITGKIEKRSLLATKALRHKEMSR